MTAMKPIPFNTEMVRAILDGRKTVTRRVVKPQLKTKCSHGGQHEFIQDDFIEGVNFTGFVCRKCGYGVCGPHFKFPVGTSWIRPPYRPGDILYVRETWGDYSECQPGGAGYYLYRADYPDGAEIDTSWDGVMYDLPRWRPSIHMPREAARIFLRVTDVRVERLQDITPEQAVKEGVIDPENRPYIQYERVGQLEWYARNRLFPPLWDSTINPADRALYGWDANPWVWVIEFKRREKPKEVS